MLWCVHLNILNLFTVCWFLYLVRTTDNALYTGITTDVARRFLQHQTGKGAKALRGKGELQLAFSAAVGDRSLALRLEYRIKQLTRTEKERLIHEDTAFSQLLPQLEVSRYRRRPGVTLEMCLEGKIDA